MSSAAKAPQSTSDTPGPVRSAVGALEHVADVLTALDQFVEVWISDGEAVDMIGESCTLTCDEADSLAGLAYAVGHSSTAEALLREHAADDRCGDRHHTGCSTCQGDAPGPTPTSADDVPLNTGTRRT